MVFEHWRKTHEQVRNEESGREAMGLDELTPVLNRTFPLMGSALWLPLKNEKVSDGDVQI